MKKIKIIFVTLWFIFSLHPVKALAAAVSDEELAVLEFFKQCPPIDRDIIYFGNGVGSGADETLAQANTNKYALILAYGVHLRDSFPDDDAFQYCVAYNASRGRAKDFIEVLNQKFDETGGLTASEILYLLSLSKDAALIAIKQFSTASGGGRIVVELAVEAVDQASDLYIKNLEEDANGVSRYYQQATTDLHSQRYFSDLCRGSRVVVVAHSQGNLFANEAVKTVIDRHPNFEQSIGIVGVASPANRVIGNNDYVTAHDDRVIDALRVFHDVLDSTVDNDLFLNDNRDFFNHAFIQSYLSSELPSNGLIEDMITAQVENLNPPNLSTIPNACESVGVASVTIKDKDTNTVIPNVNVTAIDKFLSQGFGSFSGVTDEEGRYTFNLPITGTDDLYSFEINTSGYTPVLSDINSVLQSGTECTISGGLLGCLISSNAITYVTILLEKSTDEFALVEVKRIGFTGEALPSTIPTTAQVDNLASQVQNPAFFNTTIVPNSSNIVRTTDLPQYNEMVAICSEPDCTLIPGDSDVIYAFATCNGSVCEEHIELNTMGQLTRVVFLYDECASGYEKAENGIDCVAIQNNQSIDSLIFEDENLKACVQASAIGQGVNSVDQLRFLFCNGRHISNINGIEQFVNLRRTSFFGNQLTDITPLANLTGLTRLNVSSNQLTDITPLANLTGLTRLNVSFNQLTDITPLANLTGLTSLGVSFNQLTDITPLANLTGLTSLGVSSNQLTNITPLANLTGLTSFDVRNNQLTDITPLANLTGLTSLSVSSNQLTNITPLANLTGLTRLFVSSNQITDITPLTNLTGLTSFDVRNNQITDITPLTNLTGLTSLDIRDNDGILCTDIDFLETVLINLTSFFTSSCVMIEQN